MRTALLHGLVAGALAGAAATIYAHTYNFALATDYGLVAKPIGILATCVAGCLLASSGYHFFRKWVKRGTDVWFNAIFTVITFASIMGAFGATLPLDIRSPELFFGFAIPMHLMPQLFWLSSKPLFSYA